MEKKIDTGTRVSCVSQGRSATLAFLFSCCTAVVLLLLRYSVYKKKKKADMRVPEMNLKCINAHPGLQNTKR